MKALQPKTIHSQEAAASELAERHRRVSTPRRRPTGLPKEGSARLQPQAPRTFQSWRWLKIVGGLGVISLVVVGLISVYRAFASSSFFALREIEWQGVVRAPKDEMERALRERTSEGLWRADLRELRKALERYPWVREAEVVRLLPDKLLVTIHEREPIALVRRSTGALVWVDRDGVVLGERLQFGHETIPPLLSGLDESNDEAASEANRRRLLLYQQLLEELDQGERRLSEVVDEVEISDPQDIRLRLAARRLLVVVGDRDFRSRLEAALKVLSAIERKDLSTLNLLNVSDARRLINGGRVAYLNATRPDRVIVGLAQ